MVEVALIPQNWASDPPKVRKSTALRQCICTNVSKSDTASTQTQIKDMPMETRKLPVVRFGGSVWWFGLVLVEVALIPRNWASPIIQGPHIVVLPKCVRTNVSKSDTGCIHTKVHGIPTETRNLPVVLFGASIWWFGLVVSVWLKLPHPSPNVRKVLVLRQCIRTNLGKSEIHTQT